MTEIQALNDYCTARDRYDARPNYTTASDLLRRAQALVDISDDYAALLDEADDIVTEQAEG